MCIMISANILNSTTVFNIEDNNNKCFSTDSAY